MNIITTIVLRVALCQQSVQLDILLKTKKIALSVLQVSIAGQHQTTVIMASLTIVRIKKGTSAELEVGLPIHKLKDLILFNKNLIDSILTMDQ